MARFHRLTRSEAEALLTKLRVEIHEGRYAPKTLISEPTAWPHREPSFPDQAVQQLFDSKGRVDKMSSKPGVHRALVFLALCAALVSIRASVAESGDDLPARLTDQEFWALSEQLSEAGGACKADNLLTKERTYQKVLPGLTRTRT